MLLLLFFSALLAQEPLDALLRQLASDSVEERERAAAELVRKGEAVLPDLEKRAAATSDTEVAGRLRGVIRDILVPPDVRALVDGVTSGRWSWYGAPDRPVLREEMIVGVGRELLGSPVRKAACAKLAGKREPGSAGAWKSDQEGIDALKKEGAPWCLSAGLFHSSYLVQLRCADALADLKDRKVAPVLLDVARALAVPVEGSKTATVHGFRQHGIAKAIDRLLGTSAAWDQGQNTEALLRAIPVWTEALKAGPAKD